MPATSFSRLRTLPDPDHLPALRPEYIRSQPGLGLGPLDPAPRILLLDEPTRGIDVGSKAEIHNLLRELAAQGYAVIVISSEMPEVLHVSDRIIAMYRGRITRTFTSDEVSEDSLIQAISGIETQLQAPSADLQTISGPV